MEKSKIIGVEWRCGRCTTGIVAFKTEGGWRAVIGQGEGFNEEYDIQTIADFGSRLQKKEACAFFPRLNPDDYVI